MRSLGLICCAAALALPGAVGAPEGSPMVTVTEVEGGIEITNTGDIPVIVFVKSPDGEQQLELDVGESVPDKGITGPIEVLVVGEGVDATSAGHLGTTALFYLVSLGDVMPRAEQLNVRCYQ